MALRLEVDPDACMSHGHCIAAHPDAFTFDDDEISRVVAGERDLTDEERRAVARLCPVSAIKVIDVVSGEELPVW
jgi:ferredoxin